MRTDVNYVRMSGVVQDDSKTFGTDNKVLTFTIVSQRAYKDKTFKTFMAVKKFGSKQTLAKGEYVLVEGELGVESWEDKNTGDKKYKSVITAKAILRLIPDELSPEQEAEETRKQAQSQNNPPTPTNPPPQDDGDDLPF